MRLIDADRLKEDLTRFYDGEVCARNLIDEQPSAEPQIIRCNDCMWNDGTAYCEMHFRDVKGNDFCSWAERRTDETVQNNS